MSMQMSRLGWKLIVHVLSCELEYNVVRFSGETNADYAHTHTTLHNTANSMTKQDKEQ
jgi:hypothetical protein